MSPARWGSIAVLTVFSVIAAVVLFRVVRPFLFPLFFSLIMAVLFRPVHQWFTRLLRGRVRIAAAVTTIVVVLTVMIPVIGALLLAGIELLDAGQELLVANGLHSNGVDGQADLHSASDEVLVRLRTWLGSWLTPEQIDELGRRSSAGAEGLINAIYLRTQAFVADAVVFVIGLIVMTLGFYYLLADGKNVAREMSTLLPLDVDDQTMLFGRFESVCRGVVIGTVVAGVVQGVLAGIGFAIVGIQKIWILAVLTVFFSFTPFLGAAMIWTIVVGSLLLQQRYMAAVFLTVYGALVISLADNFIKAYIIGNRAQMHPFIVLVTVLGALQFAGLWGIFLGPVTVAFFYALLTSLRNKLVPRLPNEPTVPLLEAPS